jgi:hypothetical protein
MHAAVHLLTLSTGAQTQKVKEGTGNYGFNAATSKYGDLVTEGVIDPVKVVRSGLQNAASVASLAHHRGPDRREAQGREAGSRRRPLARRHGRRRLLR